MESAPVIDSFHKWLDAYTTYMLVIVAAYPRRALELLKYQQIISRAESKFKGLAWLAYDEQFRRYAASDLTRPWDLVDLELWTVTFSGLAKPHCFVCSSPYHSQADCPKADPTRRQHRRSGSCCFSFNKPTGCNRRSCKFPTSAADVVHLHTHSPNVPQMAPPRISPPETPAIVARNSNILLSHHQRPTVSTPINVAELQKELCTHPDRNFVNSLLNALNYGARIGYLGPQKARVSRNLISASQHPEVVSVNLARQGVLSGKGRGAFSFLPFTQLPMSPSWGCPQETFLGVAYHLPPVLP